MTDSEREILNGLWSLFDYRRTLPEGALLEAVPLPAHLQSVLDGRMSEYGFCLRSDVEVVGLPEMPCKRVIYKDGILALDRRTLSRGTIKKEVLLYDLPYEVIFRPACRSVLSDLVGKPVDLATHALTVQSVFAEAVDKGGHLWGKERTEDYQTLSRLSLEELMEETVALSKEGGEEKDIFHPENLEALYGRIEKVVDNYPSQDVPAVQVGIQALKEDMENEAWEWMGERYGWASGEGQLLPLQVLAYGKGNTGDLLDRSGLVAGPTSSGKTLVAEMRMMARWSRTDHARRHTVMLVPTKEIGIERSEEMRLAYGYDAGDTNSKKLRVVYSDGDHGFEDYQIWRGDFDIAILVNEKFRYFQQSDDFLAQVGEIIVDEMELIGKDERGKYLELLITSVLTTQKDIAVTCLSRQFSNPDEMRALLSRDGDAPYFVQAQRRPVLIEIGVWEPNSQMVTYTDCNDFSVKEEPLRLHYPSKDIREPLKELIRTFLTQTEFERENGFTNNLVLATPTKRDNLILAEAIRDLYNTDLDVQMLVDKNSNTRYIRDRLRSLEPSQRKKILEGLLPNGIGVHDADLSPQERMIVSRAFRDLETPILITSQTMAYGVNLPAQSIVFLGWGGRPFSPDREKQYDQYVVKLQDDFVTWLGRVGRFGQPNHRVARALYLCVGGRASEEYRRIMGLVSRPVTPIYPSLAENLQAEDTVLYVLRSVQQQIGGGATWDEIAAFYGRIYKAEEQPYMAGQGLAGLVRIGGMKFSDDFMHFEEIVKRPQWPEEDLEAVVDRMIPVIPTKKREAANALLSACLSARKKEAAGLSALRLNANDAAFRALFIEKDDTATFTCVDLDRVDDGLIFESNRMGNIACGFGVQTETVHILHEWLEKNVDYSSSWHVLDLFALVRQTPDGERIPNLRPSREHYDQIKADYAKLVNDLCVDDNKAFGTTWAVRSPLMQMAPANTHLVATFLALFDWLQGMRLMPPDERAQGIETKYMLHPYGSNIRDRAKDYGRILRVVEAIASAMPKLSEEQQEDGSASISEESRDQAVVVLPRDIPILVDELQQGMPQDASDLGRTGIEGLSRTWALNLFDKMEEADFEKDLPVLERLRLFTDEPAFFDIVPTPGLGQRIKKELEEKPRAPISEWLRHSPDEIKSFYAHKAVCRFQTSQGFGRYTALRMSHRRAYSVMRRNISKRNPIVIETDEQYEEWVGKGAVEFLSEIGIMAGGGQYYVDRFLVDLDPRNEFLMDDLKALTVEIGKRLASHAWAQRVYYHWTGGRGYHIIGEFKEDIGHDAEHVKRVLERMVDRLSDDVAIFTDEQPYLLDPYVVMDLKPVMQRGLYRNALSINSNTSGVAIPLTEKSIAKFDPEQHATIEAVTHFLNLDSASVLQQDKEYGELVQTFSDLFLTEMV